MSCRGECNGETLKTRPNLWSVKLLISSYTTQDSKGPVNSQGCPHQTLNRDSDRHPPSTTAIIPITATFSVKCKVVQSVSQPASQPARKRGQSRVLTISSGSFKRYCVCRQLLTVHFVSMWGGQLWRHRGVGGVIRCMTYVPFILIPSKEPGLIKLTSDAVLSPLINGCGNRTKMQSQGRRWGGCCMALSSLSPTCHHDSVGAWNDNPAREHGYLWVGQPLPHSVWGVPLASCSLCSSLNHMKQIRLIIGIPTQSQSLHRVHVMHTELVGASSRNKEASLYLHSLCLLHTLTVWCGLAGCPVYYRLNQM